MKKFFKIFFIVIILLLALIVSVPFLFKGKIIELAKKEINNSVNATVEFGEFDLSVFRSFPNLNFEINDLKVIGIEEFSNDTLLSLNRLSTDVDILSVFGDNIKVKSISIENADIKVKVLKDGRANWDVAPASEEETPEEEVTEESSSAMNLALNEFVIKSSNIIYDDAELDVYTEIKNLNFSLSGDLSESFTSLETKTTTDEFTVGYEGVKYLNKVKLDIDADIDADLDNFKFTFKENLAKLNELAIGFNGYVAMPAEDIDMDISFDARQTEFKHILSLIPAIYAKDFETIQTSGKMAINGFAKGIYNDNSLPAFDINLLIDNAMFKYPDLPGTADNINVNLNIKNNDGIEDHTVINLKKFHIDFAKNPFDAKMILKTPISDPQIDASLKGVIDLAGIKDIMPIEDMTLTGIMTADISMDGKMSYIDNEDYEKFNADGTVELKDFLYKSEDLPQDVVITNTILNFTPRYLDLKTFDATIGKSDIHADGKINNFIAYALRDEILTGKFNLNSKYFNLNELMGETTEETEEVATETTEEDLSVVEVPGNIDFTLNSTFDKLIYDNIDIDNVKGSLVVKDSKVSMKDLRMNLLKGSMLLNGEYNTQDINKPAVDFTMDIKNFDIPQTFKTFNTVQKIAPIGEKCTGNISTLLKFKCILDPKMEPIMNTINGGGTLKTNRIIINNADVFMKIGEFLKTDKYNQVDLNDAKVLFEIIDGNIEVQPFTTKIGKTKAEIYGKQGIDQTIDYKIDMAIPRKELGSKANSALESLLGAAGSKGVDLKVGEEINVKALIGGTLTNPTVKLDFKDQAKNVVEDIKEQIVDKVKEEVDKAKQEAIKRAKEQAAKLMSEANAKGKQIIVAAEQGAKATNAAAKKAADKIRSEANNEAQKLINAAKGKPKFARDIAKKAANKIKAEAEKKAKKLENEAAKKSNAAVNKAKQETENLKNKAKNEGDALIRKAEQS